MLIMIYINVIIYLQKGEINMSRFIKVSVIIAAVALMLLLVPTLRPKEVIASPANKERTETFSGLIVEYDEDGNVVTAISSVSLDD